MTAPLSSSTRCAFASSEGSSRRTSSRCSSTSARLTTHEADIGIARALSISAVSSSSLAWMSTPGLPSRAGSLRWASADLFLQPLEHRWGDEPRDVPAPRGHLFDEARREETVERVGRHEQRLDTGQRVVHLPHLELVVEVADGAETFDDRLDAAFLAEVDEQAVEAVDDDVGQVGGRLPQQLDALLGGEQALFALVDEHGDDDLVEQRADALDDVDVPAGHRVEGAWADGAPHGRRPYQRVLSP